ncbi:hypothetical protein RRG08_011402 [Elysia crispata]|uniref:Uncharacterized protein n=1 Tax=Elysia crispata TaxID=231223 RepID=A0AAE0ZL41_9GAST|nr:hypothetical protein RRG08_011402 [Elysia crispata]
MLYQYYCLTGSPGPGGVFLDMIVLGNLRSLVSVSSHIRPSPFPNFLPFSRQLTFTSFSQFYTSGPAPSPTSSRFPGNLRSLVSVSSHIRPSPFPNFLPFSRQLTFTSFSQFTHQAQPLPQLPTVFQAIYVQKFISQFTHQAQPLPQLPPVFQATYVH